MLLVILHMYTRTPSISTLPSPSYHWPSVRGTHRDERQVRGFQEWQPAFARSHIRIVGDPDITSTQKRTKSPCVTTMALNSVNLYSQASLQSGVDCSTTSLVSCKCQVLHGGSCSQV